MAVVAGAGDTAATVARAVRRAVLGRGRHQQGRGRRSARRGAASRRAPPPRGVGVELKLDLPIIRVFFSPTIRPAGAGPGGAAWAGPSEPPAQRKQRNEGGCPRPRRRHRRRVHRGAPCAPRPERRAGRPPRTRARRPPTATAAWWAAPASRRWPSRALPPPSARSSGSGTRVLATTRRRCRASRRGSSPIGALPSHPDDGVGGASRAAHGGVGRGAPAARGTVRRRASLPRRRVAEGLPDRGGLRRRTAPARPGARSTASMSSPWTPRRRSPPSRISGRSSPGATLWTDLRSVSDPGGVVKAAAGLCRGLDAHFVAGDARTLRRRVRTAGPSTAATGRSPPARRWWRSVRGRRTCSVRSATASRSRSSAATTCTTRPRAMRRSRGPSSTRSAATSSRRWTRASASPPAPSSPAAMRRSRRCSSTSPRRTRAQLFPLAARREAEPWMGSRPCLPDMLPVIGPAPRHKGLWLAFGHQHSGFTLGPPTGRLLAELMTGEDALRRSRAVPARTASDPASVGRAPRVAVGERRRAPRAGTRGRA